jgi:hypothetical protein
MSWRNKLFLKPPRKGFSPKVGDEVIAKRAKGLAREGTVTVVAGIFYKVRINGRGASPAHSADFELSELRPRPLVSEAIKTVLDPGN